MQKDAVIVVTGAAGFIGSVLTGHLNDLGYEQLVLVDDFSSKSKTNNLIDKKYLAKVHRDQFFDWLEEHPGKVAYVFHLGARTDTAEFNYEIFRELNVRYSKSIWEYCTENGIPLVYASSAATYGNGEFGYDDNEALIPQLAPLNPYGVSKQKFDVWALEQKSTPPFWAGLKFFNVYGPNEYHKGRMASVILHAYQQILKNDGEVKLFRSHKPEYADGGQMRDFIYVKDLVKVCTWLMLQQPENGIYNLGTGTARTFNDLINALYNTLGLPTKITYIDTPEDIREKYQYFTEANMKKLIDAGYKEGFYSLEEGVSDYVTQYLKETKYH
ncbi:ADP-glyceromanno-heptose 6-epimerase [Taibaiella sp. KBW10]|uniref:ADP-glyceromanno-heptose 6-epimerase n=1 Tax=Taibaiella sp. KBW10 TaxID=2153357 RepID=UPI000F59C55C|nr:ADP-glyceromanno-heptose 6-epimerase [Taibaiella sp. KBW10]RQO31365.1 ADP-glyceromanno-heptose 6-epimerase [Taibaiella sp. KBW10]